MTAMRCASHRHDIPADTPVGMILCCSPTDVRIGAYSRGGPLSGEKGSGPDGSTVLPCGALK